MYFQQNISQTNSSEEVDMDWEGLKMEIRGLLSDSERRIGASLPLDDDNDVFDDHSFDDALDSIDDVDLYADEYDGWDK